MWQENVEIIPFLHPISSSHDIPGSWYPNSWFALFYTDPILLCQLVATPLLKAPPRGARNSRPSVPWAGHASTGYQFFFGLDMFGSRFYWWMWAFSDTSSWASGCLMIFSWVLKSLFFLWFITSGRISSGPSLILEIATAKWCQVAGSKCQAEKVSVIFGDFHLYKTIPFLLRNVENELLDSMFQPLHGILVTRSKFKNLIQLAARPLFAEPFYPLIGMKDDLSKLRVGNSTWVSKHVKSNRLSKSLRLHESNWCRPSHIASPAHSEGSAILHQLMGKYFHLSVRRFFRHYAHMSGLCVCVFVANN